MRCSTHATQPVEQLVRRNRFTSVGLHQCSNEFGLQFGRKVDDFVWLTGQHDDGFAVRKVKALDDKRSSVDGCSGDLHPAMVIRLEWIRASGANRTEVQGMIDMAGASMLLRQIMGSSAGVTVVKAIANSRTSKISKYGVVT